MNRQYIGARYVPKIFDNNGSNEWVSGIAYEALTIVTYLNNSYTSKKPVPSTVDSPNVATEYWANTGNYVGVVSELTEKVDNLETDLTEYKAENIVTPEMYGASGDGLTNDTEYVQMALDSGKTVVLNKTYLVTASTEAPWHIALTVNSNTRITGNGTLKLATNNYPNYSVLRMYNCDNVDIDGITIIGDSDTHTGATGEWGYGIDIDYSRNITVSNVKVSNMWGDGIIVNHLDDEKPFTEKNYNVVIKNCYIKHCGRNCITVSHGENIIIDGCIITDAYRTAPKDLIDVEPDQNENVKYLKIMNCILHDNSRGIELVNGRGDYFEASNNMIYNVNTPFSIAGYAPTPSLNTDITNNMIIDCDTVVSGSLLNYNFINNFCYLTGDGDVALETSLIRSKISGNTFKGKVTGSFIKLGGTQAECSNNTFYEPDCETLIEAIGYDVNIKNNISIGTMGGDLIKIGSDAIATVQNNSLITSKNGNVYTGSNSIYRTFSSFNNFKTGGSALGDCVTNYDILNNTAVV